MRSQKAVGKTVSAIRPVFSLYAACALILYLYAFHILPARSGIDWYYSGDAGCGGDYAMGGNWSGISLPFSAVTPPRHACFLGLGSVPPKLDVRAQDCIGEVLTDGRSVYASGTCNTRCMDCGGRVIDSGESGKKMMVVSSNFGSLLRFDAGKQAPVGAVQFAAFALISLFIILADDESLKRHASVFAVGLLASAAFTLPLFERPDYWGRGDWDNYLAQSAILKKTILGYHQPPLWNPYQCGGNVLLAYPGTSFPSPPMALEFLIGEAVGAKINVLLYEFVAFLGCALLAAHMGMTARSRLLFGFVYAFSGFFANRLWEGHMSFMSMAYLPYVLLYLLKSFQKARYAIPCAVFVVLFVAMSHPSLVVVMAVLLVLVPAGESMTRLLTSRAYGIRYAAQPLVAMALIGILSASLFGFRLLPELDFSIHNPRELLEDSSGFDWSLLYASLTEASHAAQLPNGVGWHEYAGFIGLPALVLSLAGLAASYRKWRRYLPLYAFLIFVVAVSFGANSWINLWGTLNRLPLFNSLQLPTRAIAYITFILAMFSAVGLSLIESRSANAAKIAFILVIAVLIPPNASIMSEAFKVMPYVDSVEASSFQQMRPPSLSGAYSSMYVYSRQNVGVANCYQPGSLDIRVAANKATNYVGETYLLGGPGSAHYSHFTPNEFSVDVNASGPDLMVVNQNFDPGWKLDGGKVRSYHGLISTNVTAETRTLHFRYMPGSFVAGSILTAMGVAILLLLTQRFGLAVFSPAPNASQDKGREEAY